MSLGESLKSYRSSFREKISSLLWFCKHTTEHLVAGERSPKNKNFDCRLTGQGIRDTCLLAGLPACLLARCGRHSGQLSGRRFCVSLRVCLHVCLRKTYYSALAEVLNIQKSCLHQSCRLFAAGCTTGHHTQNTKNETAQDVALDFPCFYFNVVLFDFCITSIVISAA